MAGRIWTREEDEQVMALYADTKTGDVARLLNRSDKAVYSRANILGVGKSVEFLKSEASGRMMKADQRGRSGQFKPGQVPFNKGKRQKDFMSAEAIANSKATRFMKGNLPHNTSFDGDVRVRVDTKSGIPYKYVRVKLACWKLLQRVVWEKEHGKLPKGWVVKFINGDTMNCELSNLKAIPRAKNMEANTIQRYPKELIRTIKAVARLNKTIAKHEKQH